MAGLVPFNRDSRLSNSSDLYNLIDDFFSDAWSPGRNLLRDTFKLDVKDEKDHYAIEADLPGIKKDNVSIDFHDGRMTIGIKQDEVSEEKDEADNYLHRERHFSSMQRSIHLADAMADGIEAKLDDGVLKIKVPKDLKAKTASKIEIK